MNEPDTMEEQCLKYFPKPFRRESGSNEGDYYISYRLSLIHISEPTRPY